jgi:hypothetical protein
MTDKLTIPPGHKEAHCCGTCQFWKWEYEGEGTCTSYPETRKTAIKWEHIYYARSTMICDKWEDKTS